MISNIKLFMTHNVLIYQFIIYYIDYNSTYQTGCIQWTLFRYSWQMMSDETGVSNRIYAIYTSTHVVHILCDKCLCCTHPV